VTWRQVQAAQPDVVILMPCGFSVARSLRELNATSLRNRWPDWEQLPAVQRDQVYVVDAAAYFSRPGPRLIDGVEILAALLHPSLCPGDAQPTPAQAQRLPQPGRAI
jgi:iron complex transport system substrate-binding protein